MAEAGALARNILRIGSAVWWYNRFDIGVGEEYAHDVAGRLMIPPAPAPLGPGPALLSGPVVER